MSISYIQNADSIIINIMCVGARARVCVYVCLSVILLQSCLNSSLPRNNLCFPPPNPVSIHYSKDLKWQLISMRRDH